MAPKYCFLADTLRLEIANGQYSDSQMLPTEQQLCQRFQSSRSEEHTSELQSLA